MAHVEVPIRKSGRVEAETRCLLIDFMSSTEPDTRKRILNAAWELLEKRGGGGVSMSDIAKSAGISRQAVYLHFPTRVELLVATTRHLDEVKDIDARLETSRNATSALERLDAFIEAWGNYIPEIHGVAKAMIAMSVSDKAPRQAWADRMNAVREGCEATDKALRKDGIISHSRSLREATDILWALLSVQMWEAITRDCGWSQHRYLTLMKQLAREAFTVDRSKRS